MTSSLQPFRDRRVLVTGAGGLLGFALLPELQKVGAAVVGIWRSTPVRVQGVETRQCDLRNAAETSELLRETRPDWVIHAAALTDVGLCENEPALAEATNVAASRSIAAAARGAGARVAYISSEAVYGDGATAHSERAACQPLSVYARSKLAGEAAVQEEVPRALVVRTTLVGVAPELRRSLVAWLLESFSAGKAINGFRDVFFSPLFTADFSRLLIDAMARGLTGVWNIGAADTGSKFEFARALAEALGYDTALVNPGLLRETALSGPRCYQAALDCSRFKDVTGCDLPTIRQGIARFAAQMPTILARV